MNLLFWGVYVVFLVIYFIKNYKSISVKDLGWWILFAIVGFGVFGIPGK